MAQVMAAMKRTLFSCLFPSFSSFDDTDSKICALDGSQRPRLINMRIARSGKGKSSVRDFLTKLLGRKSPLIRERIMRRKAMMHWFLQGEDVYVEQIVTSRASLHSALLDDQSRLRMESLATADFQLPLGLIA